MSQKHRYTLTLTIKKGKIHGGGLPNQAYVDVFLDGSLFASTSPVAPPHEFNHEIVMTLPELTKRVVSFTVYKKRWTSSGFKTIGTVQMDVGDLMGQLNQTGCSKEMPIMAIKNNLTLGGSLLFHIELKETPGYIDPNENTTGSTLSITKERNFAGKILYFSNPTLGIAMGFILVLVLAIFIYLNYRAWSAVDENMAHLSALAGPLKQKLSEAAARAAASRGDNN